MPDSGNTRDTHPQVISEPTVRGWRAGGDRRGLGPTAPVTLAPCTCGGGPTGP